MTYKYGATSLFLGARQSHLGKSASKWQGLIATLLGGLLPNYLFHCRKIKQIPGLMKRRICVFYNLTLKSINFRLKCHEAFSISNILVTPLTNS